MTQTEMKEVSSAMRVSGWSAILVIALRGEGAQMSGSQGQNQYQTNYYQTSAPKWAEHVSSNKSLGFRFQHHSGEVLQLRMVRKCK